MPKTILIAVDSGAVRNFLATALKSRGYAVEAVKSEATAYELLAERKTDLLLTDLKSSGLDGLSLISRVRKEMNNNLPIIALSFPAGDEEIKKSLECGADSCLIKPLNAERVQLEVEKYIG